MKGRVVIIGSGELGPAIVPTLRAIDEATHPQRVVVLDGSYRFQANADMLSAKITEHLARSLDWRPEVVSVTSDDQIGEAVRIAAADLVFAGPGSPTYALRQWNHPPIVDALQAVVENGGTLVMASAAALTLGLKTLPVYEIYKAGEDPYWVDGLDILGRLGINAVVIPHWNNREGGTHDTSRCFVGEARFRILEEQLPEATLVIGVDEHTSLTINLADGSRRVEGAGSITIREKGRAVAKKADIGNSAPEPDGDHIAQPDSDEAEDWVAAVVAAAADPHRLAELSRQLRQAGHEHKQRAVAPYVEVLIALRRDARTQGHYELADQIRHYLAELGVTLHDGPETTTWMFTSSP